MKNSVKLLLLGFMTWAVPFFASFFFYGRSGTLSINIFFFKSIMIVVGGITGAIAVILYYRKLEKSYLKQGILIGFAWYILNVVLDLLLLIPMSKMTYSDYFAQIGFGYLMIPITCILSGYLLEIKSVKL